MNGRFARLTFLGTCLALALLLVTGIITPVMCGAAFAVSLVVLGVLSGGFRNP